MQSLVRKHTPSSFPPPTPSRTPRKKTKNRIKYKKQNFVRTFQKLLAVRVLCTKICTSPSLHFDVCQSSSLALQNSNIKNIGVENIAHSVTEKMTPPPPPSSCLPPQDAFWQ